MPHCVVMGWRAGTREVNANWIPWLLNFFFQFLYYDNQLKKKSDKGNEEKSIYVHCPLFHYVHKRILPQYDYIFTTQSQLLTTL